MKNIHLKLYNFAYTSSMKKQDCLRLQNFVLFRIKAIKYKII